MPMSVTGNSTSRTVVVPRPTGSPGSAAGFTLLELLVVVFIIGIMATMFTISVGVAGGTDRELRRESERLESLLALALEDAVFQSHELGLRLYPQRYEFSTYERGDPFDPEDDKWVPIERDVFAPRELPRSSPSSSTLKAAPSISSAARRMSRSATNHSSSSFRPAISVIPSSSACAASRRIVAIRLPPPSKARPP